ncbi:butyrophilin subfamily 3 member A3-like [Hippocampus comes]|uniref:butyrophilin subfamily 3 member A3-like n=2 Tax=Hippocampus comes TaxID=109280 RepID=UPI00094E507B|nr:PREDICTED: butyrophilin subfamily 3 member A3-like [Hippocampus comes]
MMKECLRFLIEPAKKLKSRLKESSKRVKLEKKEQLVESQLFIMELARELSKICQRSNVLQHIWSSDDVWPACLCRDFIVEWAAVLERKVQSRVSLSDCHYQRPENVMLVVLNADRPVKEDVTKEWLVRRQRNQSMDAVQYIPHGVWNWICEASEDVILDPDSANPELLISTNEKSMRCGLERRDVPCCNGRFDGWWCAAAQEGYASGRHYWEVEVGQRDWRLGVAKASAVRRGFRSLNTDTGYLTLRLERGKDLKALTVPATSLPLTLAPRKVGVYLDYEQGQLSFYNVDKRSHVYTFNDKFTEELVPIFGTVEVLQDLLIRSPGVKQRCLCPGPCLWS